MKNYLVARNNPLADAAWFNDFEGLFSPFSTFDNNVMRTDLKEYPDFFLLEIEIPGTAKNNIDISVENGYLTVSSEKTDRNDGTVNEWKYLRRERLTSASRSFYIGDVNEDTAAANAAKKIEIH